MVTSKYVPKKEKSVLMIITKYDKKKEKNPSVEYPCTSTVPLNTFTTGPKLTSV